MKKSYLFGLLLIFGLGFQTSTQAQDSIPVTLAGCYFNTPIPPSFLPDSTSYTMIGLDSVEVLYITFNHMCPMPFGVYDRNNDTSFVEIRDTAAVICLGSCYLRFKLRLPFPNDSLNLQLGHTFHQLIKSELLSSPEVQALSESPFKVYPNPSRNQFQVDFTNNSSGRYELVNANGQKVLSRRFQNTNLLSLDVLDLPSGMYYLFVQTEEYTLQHKLIKM